TLVPAYVEPAQLAALADRRRRPRVVVFNPDSGPGGHRSAAYAQAVERARGAGMRVLGYVATGYGTRPRADVEADIDRYARWYGTDGIFLDETPHAGGLVGRYRALAARAREAGQRLVVVNPGMVPARGYFGFADIVVTFEGAAADYRRALASSPSWLDGIAPARIAHLVYGASREDALAAVGANAHAGYLYATSGSLPNPWKTVPDYLDEEEALLER
ncbi:MAG TPA: spherulation-specific family 4 protein, partial [Solirubrobacteraceae bacterium]|nr:spherulation-specific family 4 protein [Solirubrobacteraceae bacterium]